MTVEEYLKSAAQKRATELKRHGEELIQRYDSEFKRARQVLRDVANEQIRAATADESNSSDGAAALPGGVVEATAVVDQQCDAFALVAIRGTHKGRSFKIEPSSDKKVWTIGRTSDNDICLSGDDEVSSAHAKVMFDRKQFKLQDLSSTNGTYATNGAGSTCKLKPRKNHVLKLDHLVSFGMLLLDCGPHDPSAFLPQPPTKTRLIPHKSASLMHLQSGP
eukprot:scaffold153041_cov28-Tisochrysis_lutea.AAC.1